MGIDNNPVVGSAGAEGDGESVVSRKRVDGFALFFAIALGVGAALGWLLLSDAGSQASSSCDNGGYGYGYGYGQPCPLGNFIVGDVSARNLTAGTQVNFWGAQWWKNNVLSGGSAPAALKGFADHTSPSPPSCGGTWTTDPGNSASPPDARRARSS